MCMGSKPPAMDPPPLPPPPPPESKPMEMQEQEDPRKGKRLGTKRLQISMTGGAGGSGVNVPK